MPLCCPLKLYKGSSYSFWRRKLTYHSLVHLLHPYKRPSWEHILYTPGPHKHKIWSLMSRNVCGGLLKGSSVPCRFPTGRAPKLPFILSASPGIKALFTSPWLIAHSLYLLGPVVLFSSLFRYLCLGFISNTFLALHQNCSPRSLSNRDTLIVTSPPPVVSEWNVSVYLVSEHDTVLSSLELRWMSSCLWGSLAINTSSILDAFSLFNYLYLWCLK